MLRDARLYWASGPEVPNPVHGSCEEWTCRKSTRTVPDLFICKEHKILVVFGMLSDICQTQDVLRFTKKQPRRLFVHVRRIACFHNDLQLKAFTNHQEHPPEPGEKEQSNDASGHS